MGNDPVIPVKQEGSDPKISYQATMQRSRWRTIYLKCEVTSPTHKASQRWLSEAAAQLFDVAEVKIKAGGEIKAKVEFNAGKATDLVTLQLSRDAVLGIKFAVVAALDGTSGMPGARPSPLLERRDLLDSCGGIGPDGIFRKLVEKEAKLPEDGDLDEGSELDEMDKKKE